MLLCFLPCTSLFSRKSTMIRFILFDLPLPDGIDCDIKENISMQYTEIFKL